MSTARAYPLSTRPRAAAAKPIKPSEDQMPPVDPLITLAGQFADGVWEQPVGAVGGWAGGFAADCVSQGIELRRVVEVQADETLALAIQKGAFIDVAFVELLVHRFGPRLPGWFVRHGHRYGRTVGDELSNELVQELWFRQFRARFGGYDPTQEFGAFLFVVTRNLFVQRVLRPRREVPLADWEGSTHADTVGLEVEFGEMLVRLDDALERLSTDYREVLRLKLAGHAPEAIAGMLGVPVKTVYRRLFHARRAVEQYLSG